MKGRDLPPPPLATRARAIATTTISIAAATIAIPDFTDGAGKAHNNNKDKAEPPATQGLVNILTNPQKKLLYKGARPPLRQQSVYLY